jgi:serine/threonine-protein kinase
MMLSNNPDTEDFDLAFCQEALKKKYLSTRNFKECLVAHAAIMKMGLTKPTIRDIVTEQGGMKPEQITEVMAILGSRSDKRVIEGYSLLEKVTSGAFGSVYKAKQDSMERIVALKVLPRRLALNKIYVKNFMRETKLAAKLAHENIVYVLDAGQSIGLLYLAMEYIDGETTERLVRRQGPMSEKRALGITWSLARALVHAHGTGILHRDIKPANVLMKDKKTPKLCDFGLAKSTARQALMEVSGLIVGTPSYMAPEQILGERVDERTDIYGLGATLYFIATAKKPFPAGRSFDEVYENQIKNPMQPLRDAYSKISPRIEKLVEKMMHRDREKRFQNAVEVIDVLMEIARQDKKSS